jgi:hypothetical protein
MIKNFLAIRYFLQLYAETAVEILSFRYASIPGAGLGDFGLVGT